MYNRHSPFTPSCAGDSLSSADLRSASRGCGQFAACSCASLATSNNNSPCCPDTALEIINPSFGQAIRKLRNISGIAEAGEIVKIRVDDHCLLEAKVKCDNTWQVKVPFSLDSGCHTIYAISTQCCNASNYVNFTIDNISEPDPCPDPCPCAGPCAGSCPDQCSRPCQGQCSCPCDCSEQCTCSCSCSCPDSCSCSCPDSCSCSCPDSCSCPCPCPDPDHFLPAPVIISPSELEIVNTAFPVITGRAFPGNTVDVCIEGIMCVRTIADASGNFGVQFQAPLADGRYAVTAVQSDGICGVSCVAHTNFIVAATGVIVPPPIVTSPMEGAVIPQSVVVFAGIANVGNTITICVSGNICVSTGVNANGEFYYEYPPLPDGLYTATLLAQDSIGNTSLPVTVVFEIRTN